MRRGGNLDSRLDLGAAEVLSPKPLQPGLYGTCPLVVAENPQERVELMPVSS